MSRPVTQVRSIGEIIAHDELKIPTYQRPYTWQSKNVLQLINDIQAAIKYQPVYRIGTLIFEKNKYELNIVDGQQRLTTIVILLYELGELTPALLNAEFAQEESQINIKTNQSVIRSWIGDLSIKEANDFKTYLLNQCQVVTIELSDLAEAFQFFDSQNSRGKALDPTDLLKAFHLREMTNDDQSERLRCTDIWDNIGESSLNSLIGTYLYRIRLWTRGEYAGYFTKDNITEFKGFNLLDAPKYPYLAPYRLSEKALITASDTYAVYPFQITQLIVNGKRFFEMIGHYHQLFNGLFNGTISLEFQKFHQHSIYPEDQRTGDKYTKMLYKAAVLCYYDRFASAGFEENYPLLFMWAYKPRIENKNVRYQTSNATVHKPNNNAFRIIQESLDPKELYLLKTGLYLEKVVQDIKDVRTVFKDRNLDYTNKNVE